MLLVRTADPVVLRLNRDLTRIIKRGNPWVYADALRDLPRVASGSPAVLLDNRKGTPIALGFYDPESPLAFRVCDTNGKAKLDERWADGRLRDALNLRRVLFDSQTTGYRLMNGEGDCAPGLVIDVYGNTAVMKLDGAGPLGFWDTAGIAGWLAERLAMACVYERRKERGREGRVLIGVEPTRPVEFLENGLKYTADVIRGQKTGFFFDQRDNRRLIRNIARDRSVLNLFAYTGGFSIAAGAGGARCVSTVDLAEPAIQAAKDHWSLNGLESTPHEAIAADAYEFLADAASQRRTWDITIADPPSFAPNQQSIAKATAAYTELFAASARVTSRGGLLAAASCSSHINLTQFQQICEESLSEVRRRGTVIAIEGQAPDHPSPLSLPEFRYLKFVLLRLD
jgi:23S rRNA (cytosine1962-C5)-methyltransferase